MEATPCLCLGEGAGPLSLPRWCKAGAAGVPGSRIRPAVPGYPIAVTTVPYHLAQHGHHCFTPPDNNPPGCQNHRAELRVDREAHVIPLRVCLDICVRTYRGKYRQIYCIRTYRDKYRGIYIYSHEHVHSCAWGICSPSGREGSNCPSPVDNPPLCSCSLTKPCPGPNTMQGAENGVKIPIARSPGSTRSTSHTAAACSALQFGDRRGYLRKSMAERGDFTRLLRETASVSECHRGVCNVCSRLFP